MRIITPTLWWSHGWCSLAAHVQLPSQPSVPGHAACGIPAQPFLVHAGLRKDPKKVEKEEKAKQDAEIAKEKEAERENDTGKADDTPADEPVKSEVGFLLAPCMHA